MWIRNAEAKDLPFIKEIENEAIIHTTAIFDLEEKSLVDKEKWFENLHGVYPILVAEWEEEVAGYGYLSPYNDKLAYQTTAELSLYVNRKYRGYGIGHGLMKALLEKARDYQFHSIISLITEGNEASERLHEKYQFSHVGTLKEVGNKFDEWQNVKLYQWIGID